MKKIYFVRHGESFDDVFNEYGSWNDRELTPYGIQTAFELAHELKGYEKKYDYILTSPLKRASMTAEILGTELGLRVIEEPYVKERNTYGLLAGVNQDIAVEEYPEMNAAFLEGGYIYGSERYGDFKIRVERFLKKMEKENYENIICVTHGHVLNSIIEENFDLIRNSFNYGSILGLGHDGKEWKIFKTEKITFTDDPEVAKGLEVRKFKNT